MKRYIAYAGALTALAGLAGTAYAADTTDDSLTWFGVTLYGTVDVGYTYQNRGVRGNDYFPADLEYMVQKNATKTISTLSSNGMSQSKIGLRGTYEFAPGFSGIFKLETGFLPMSGELADGPKSLIQNNGIAARNQNANGDSSRAGQPFNAAAYAGISSKTYGTITIGRQNTLLMDNVGKYDPLGAAYAFSFVGYSGTSGGGGDTQDGRLDRSIKYVNQIGMFRISGMFQNGSGGSVGNSVSGGLGADPLPGWSIDAVYFNKKDEIAGAPLGVAAATCSASTVTTTNAINCIAANATVSNSIYGTVSDNWVWELATSYVWDKFKFSGAYEDIHFRNPQVRLAPGAVDIGGYQLGGVNNNAYPQKGKILQYMWFGGKYAYNSHLDLFAAWYYILQNQYRYGAGISCPGGNKAILDNAGCSGREAGYSLVADYKFNRHFDVYAGAMYSHLADGFASGGPNIMSIDPTLGGRFNF